MSQRTPPRLRIRLLGPLTVEYEGSDEEVALGGMFGSLLAYLVLERHRSHAREALAGVFWGDHSEARARSCLSTAIWRLRGALDLPGRESSSYIVTRHNGEIGFNVKAPFWLDVEELERSVTACGEDPARRDELEGALALYRGDCLEGVYHDWALAERERLELLYLRGLQALMRIDTRTGRAESALAAGHRILRRDPLREDVHRAVMRLYVGTGRRAMAVRHYRRCAEILDRELGIPPMAETERLHRSILEAGARRVDPVADGVDSGAGADGVEAGADGVELVDDGTEPVDDGVEPVADGVGPLDAGERPTLDALRGAAAELDAATSALHQAIRAAERRRAPARSIDRAVTDR